MDEDRVAGSAKSWAGKVEGAVGDMAGDAGTQAQGRAREAAGAVQNLFGQAKDAAPEATDTAVNYAKGDGAEAVAKLVNQNPIGALLSAAAVGFAAALLMTRPAPRRKRRWYYD
jgi:uncharacterized protein YjbJ (UPF0337 family)